MDWCAPVTTTVSREIPLILSTSTVVMSGVVDFVLLLLVQDGCVRLGGSQIRNCKRIKSSQPVTFYCPPNGEWFGVVAVVSQGVPLPLLLIPVTIQLQKSVSSWLNWEGAADAVSSFFTWYKSNLAVLEWNRNELREIVDIKLLFLFSSVGGGNLQPRSYPRGGILESRTSFR